MKTLVNTCLFFFSFVVLVSCNSKKVEDSDLCGEDYIAKESWTGQLSVGPTKLTLNFTITQLPDSTVKCTMDVPQQGARNILTEIITNDSDSLCLSIPMLQMSYYGCKKSPDFIEGKFVQRGVTLPLNLNAGSVEIKNTRPQTPQTPYDYRTKDVVFVNPNDSARLAGTIVYPVDYEKKNSRTVPVVVMVTGSGTQNRNEELFGHQPFLVIADYLAKNGIASLRYDDRGAGESVGEVEGATSLTFMADALAARSFLLQSGEFGPVGVLGHSEGGTIAIMMASRGETDFIVSLAGTAISGMDVIISQNKTVMLSQGVDNGVVENYIKALRIIYADRIKGKQIVDEQKYIDNLCCAQSISLPLEYKANLVECITAGGEWFTYFLKYNPTADIRNIKCPVMALNGTLDMQVFYQENLSSVRQNLPFRKEHMIKEYPNLNHMFQNCQPSTALSYAEIEETISPEVLKDIADWIQSLD